MSDAGGRGSDRCGGLGGSVKHTFSRSLSGCAGILHDLLGTMIAMGLDSSSEESCRDDGGCVETHLGL